MAKTRAQSVAARRRRGHHGKRHSFSIKGYTYTRGSKKIHVSAHRGHAGGHHRRRHHARRSHEVKSYESKGGRHYSHRHRSHRSITMHRVHHRKSRHTPSGFSHFRRVAQRHGYLLRGHTFKPLPRKGTHEYKVLMASYERSK